MTVTSTNYSLIEEAWADAFEQPPSSMDRPHKKKKKVRDPLCESYAKRQPAKYDDIMDTYGGAQYEQYNKLKYSRGHGNREPSMEMDVETYEEQNDMSEEEYHLRHMPVQARRKYMQRHAYLDDREKRYLDLGVYVFSGVALIFIMEQFIQIGLRMK